jgi:hypothetical protein
MARMHCKLFVQLFSMVGGEQLLTAASVQNLQCFSLSMSQATSMQLLKKRLFWNAASPYLHADMKERKR